MPMVNLNMVVHLGLELGRCRRFGWPRSQTQRCKSPTCRRIQSTSSRTQPDAIKQLRPPTAKQQRRAGRRGRWGGETMWVPASV